MKKKIIIIGAGLGGLSAAISLRQEGYEVVIHEKNKQMGGKLNVLKEEGYTFDLGPSILTLPHIFERLFERSGRKMSDYIAIRPLRPHWRNFFEDGQVVDLYPEPEKMAAEARKVGEDPANVERFLNYSGRLYDLVDAGYFQQGLDSSNDFAKFYGLWKFPQFDLFRTMHGGVKRFLKTRHMRDIFDYFIKYVGSSAYQAPAFMNCMPTIQFRYDLWYVDGGLYGIALPPGAATLLASEANPAPRPADPAFARNTVTVIASAALSLEAAADAARAAGSEVAILSDAIEGESREVAKVQAAIAREVALRDRPFRKPVVLLSGGETTVTLKGRGRGGRNTEFLLSFAIAVDGVDGISAIAADTDGIDGSDDNAGAFVDGGTARRLRQAGIDPLAALANNDAYSAFAAIGDLFVTGPTGTNVNDFRAIVVR